MKTSMAILFICLMFFSCDLFLNKENTGEEPNYTAQIAWDSGLITNTSRSHTVDGNYIYFYERPPGHTSVNIYTLTKLDAETGEFIWRSITFSDIVFCQPAVIGGHVYVFLRSNLIACFDRETGDWTATAAVDIDHKNLAFEWNISAYERYLYMGLHRNSRRYFVRVDADGITHGDPEALQELTPEVLWEPETGEPVSAKQVFYKNAVYTSTYSPVARSPVELAGFDIGSGQMVFYQTFGGPEDSDLPLPEEGAGINGNPIFIHDDILYYLSRSISAWDLKTGERLYRHVFTRDVPVSKRYVQDSAQTVYYEGKIYYTSGAPDNPMGPRNIHCIDAKTGELVWNAIAKDSESLFTNPIIAHKRLYVSQHSGLRVYEPKSGKLIGVDKRFCGAGVGLNILYKDYMICERRDPDTGDGRLVAVYVGK